MYRISLGFCHGRGSTVAMLCFATSDNGFEVDFFFSLSLSWFTRETPHDRFSPLLLFHDTYGEENGL
ncbi:hypothetical protein LMH87_003226 [Akanthomyces muscarius]|uniref:Uncharacterized protein n=1 Tax=Akanthomyces muscarius TaxID=2231603 RepID=A0A9W8Q119_AKAMU|nr:hypothetical protein LMH87_003226 [Akanthomyces muscarius]KAJ4144338.1 hypothetical protein LMH87_003226 [Akanthomyces muscarius]